MLYSVGKDSSVMLHLARKACASAMRARQPGSDRCLRGAVRPEPSL
jgi:hypothetical protein